MVDMLKQFKAILWKQYRQAFSMLIGASVIGVIIAWMWACHDSTSFEAFYAWQGILGFVSALLIILPIASVESEKKTLGFLAAKPTSSNRICILELISAYLFAIIPLIISVIVFLFICKVLQGREEFLSNHYSVIQLFLKYLSCSASSLFCFGLFFFFISTCTNNRIRSFSMAFICFVGGAIFLVYMSNATQQYYSGWIKNLYTLKLIYGYNVAPKTIIILCSLLLLPLSFLVFRFQMTRSFYRWNRYALVFAVIIIAITSVFAITIPNHNVTFIGVNQDTLEKNATSLIYRIQGRELAKTGHIRQDYVVRQNYYISVDGDNSRGAHTPDAPQFVSLSIKKLHVTNEPEIIFDKSVIDCFGEKSIKHNAIDMENSFFSNRDSWHIHVADNRGALFGRMRYRFKSLPYNDEGKSIERKPPPNSEWIFAGSFSLEDKPVFTPLKKITLNIYGVNGKETRTINCVEPGLFPYQEISNITKPILSEYKRRNKSVDKDVDKIYLKDANMIASAFSIFNFSNSSREKFLDQYTETRLYSIDYERDRTEYLWPIVTCYDFSEADNITISCGNEYKDTLPIGRIRLSYFSPYARADNFAIDDDKLYSVFPSDDGDILVVSDISDPTNIREIVRRIIHTSLFPTNWGMIDHNFKLKINNGQLIVSNMLGVYIYEIQPDYSLKPVARKTHLLRYNHIHDTQLKNDILTVYGSENTITQYALNSSGIKFEPSNQRYFKIDGDGRFTLPSKSEYFIP
jgi:hypothetical protein